MTTPLEFSAALFAVFWKSGIALSTALCMSWMLRTRSADLRRLVFSTTIVAMFVAAAATPMLPRWTAVTPSWFRLQFPRPVTVAEPSLTPALADDAAEPMVPVHGPMPPQAFTRRTDLTAWLIPLLWFAGAATLLTRFGINLRGLYRLRKASDEVTDAGLLANIAPPGRRVRLLRNGAIGAPVTWGIVRPIILVPAGFEELPAESRDAVIRHELAHIQAHDFLMRGLAEIARALIWFQPLVWIVWRQLREEQELACDNCVLAAGGKPSAYAKLLLDWEARRGMDSLIAVGIAHQSCLKRRLYALLDTDLRRDKIAGAGVAGAWLLALSAALPLAAVRFTQAVPVQPAPARTLQSASPSLKHPAARLAQAQAPPTPVRASEAQPAKQSAARPRFDVVSIKPCQPGRNGVPAAGGDSSPGRLSIGCGILADTDNVGLIQRAYNRYASGKLTSTQVIPIEGGPDWIHSERFEIEAKADGQPGILMMEGPMMQTILEDRFQLKIHRETRQGPVYELAMGRGSPKLKPLQDGSCTPVVTGNPLPLLPDGHHLCKNMVSPRGKVDIEGGTLSMFAGLLGMVLDRPVIDKTGITSYFEIHLTFSPADFAAPRPVTAEPGASAAVTGPDGPNIFQAIQEQLGLRLVPAKGPMEVLVIDHVERPSAN